MLLINNNANKNTNTHDKDNDSNKHSNVYNVVCNKEKETVNPSNSRVYT